MDKLGLVVFVAVICIGYYVQAYITKQERHKKMLEDYRIKVSQMSDSQLYVELSILFDELEDHFSKWKRDYYDIALAERNRRKAV